MNVYLTQEFAEDVKFHQFPINGFKCQLVRYPVDYNPAIDGIDQDLSFRGVSSLSDGFGWNSENGLRLLYDLIDDPLARSADTEDPRYYHGVLFIYYRLIEGIEHPMRAFLVHDPQGQLCRGINGLTLLGLRDICLMDWTDSGPGHIAPSDKSSLTSWLRSDSKLYSLYRILHDHVNATSQLDAELNYYQALVEKYNINGLIK